MPPGPIFITPRLLPRTWGRMELEGWRQSASKSDAPIGEIWPLHANNLTSEGERLGALLTREPQAMLGDLGRAPPSLRIVLTGEAESALASEAPVALWRVLEGGPEAQLSVVRSGKRGRSRTLRCKPGDLFRASDHAQITIGPGGAALEVRAGFTPKNAPTAPAFMQLASPRARRDRVTWMRDAALSVEAWRLSGESRIEPDGETCHVLTPLSDGVFVDDRALRRGEAVLIPAEGRPVTLRGDSAEALVAYPDLVPTTIWRSGAEQDRAASRRRAPTETHPDPHVRIGAS